MAGKIIADTIESAGSQISLNVGNVTVLTASSSSLALKTGSATAPGLTFSGYPTTGLYSPAANTIAFSTAGTEDMRIDSSGILSVGGAFNGGVWGERILSYTGVNAGTASAAVGIGAYNPSNTYTGSLVRVQSETGLSTSWKMYEGRYAGGGVGFYVDGTGGGYFAGNVLVGRTTQISSEKFGVEASGSNQLAYLRSTGTSGDPTLFRIASGVFSGGIGAAGNFIYCEDGGSAKFYVKGNGGIANFSASNTNLSDRRDKTNFAPAGEYLSKICNIPVQTFNFIDQNLEEDGDSTLGVVAQDVQEVAPELVTESNWGTEEEPKMRLSIYQTDLQYALMKCIQELNAKVEAQAVEIAALKAK